MSRYLMVVAAGSMALLLACAAGAQEHAHQQRPDARLGTVHFPVSCASGAQPTFDRGIALLHSFEFGAAIRAFTDVLATDSTCAMAYWALALSRWGNPMAPGNRSATLLQAGRAWSGAADRLSTNASERERGYIRAVGLLYDDYDHADQATRVRAYMRAMETLVAAQPADTEAKIFYALALAASADPADKSYAQQLHAGAVLESLWVKQPNHPGLAHYIIHSYDYPALAGRGERAAARYASIAPAAAHAQHMPSHIFTRVGDWDASIAANQRSVDIARREGNAGEQLHASDYMMYAYLQLGRVADARVILDSLPAMSARFDPRVIAGAAPPAAAYFAIAAIPARYALERGAWAEAASLRPGATSFPWCDAMTHFARALGAAHIGDTATALAAVDSLDVIRGRLVAAGERYWSEQVAIQQLGAEAWLALARGDSTGALSLMRSAAAREDATEKSAVTPGPLAPARELLADMLAQLGRVREAEAEYRATLVREPNRKRAAEGLARMTAAR